MDECKPLAMGWETMVKQVQALKYAERERGWFSLLEHLVGQGRVNAMDPAMEMPTMADMGMSGTSAHMLGKNWQDEMAPIVEYKQRELQSGNAWQLMPSTSTSTFTPPHSKHELNGMT